MVSDPSGHGWRRLLRMGHTRMRCAKGIDRAHHEYPLGQCQGVACPRPAPVCQWREAFPERRVQPLHVGCVDPPVALGVRAGVRKGCLRKLGSHYDISNLAAAEGDGLYVLDELARQSRIRCWRQP
jgi:hypothetical protein